MDAFAFVVLGLSLATAPVGLPKDVQVVEGRMFALPILMSRSSRVRIDCIRLFVSEDRGESWKHADDYAPTVRQATFRAAHDGLYWFAVQVICRDGERVPSRLEDLVPGMKVYVKGQKSYAEFQYDVQPWWEKQGSGCPHGTGSR